MLTVSMKILQFLCITFKGIENSVSVLMIQIVSMKMLYHELHKSSVLGLTLFSLFLKDHFSLQNRQLCTIVLLAVLQKSLDRAIFLYNFIREVR